MSNDRLIELIEANPKGLTTGQVIAAIGWSPSIRSTLSKMYFWGKIARQPINGSRPPQWLWLPLTKREEI